MKTFLVGLGCCLNILWLSILVVTSREVPGKVDAGGHWLRMQSVGKDLPTVVLEIELNDKLQAELARSARVVSYDRAGWRCSPPCSEPRDAAQIALELHTALANAKIPPPYLLVGDGIGGLFVRVFAARYTADVCGLVLVDPDQEEPLPGAARKWLQAHFPDELKAIDKANGQVSKGGKDWKRLEWEQSLMDRKQLLQNASCRFQATWAKLSADDSHQELSPVNIYDDMAGTPSWVVDEEQMIAVTFDQARSATLPPIPITLLTAMSTRPTSDPAEQAWLEAKRQARSDHHAAWLAKVPRSRHILARKSVDSIQEEEPELLTQAISQMLDEVRARNATQK